MVFVIIHTPRPTSKGLDHPYFACLCLLLCFMLVLASLVLGFAMLDALRGLDLVWLHPTPMRPCLDVTIWEASLDVGSLRAYSSLPASCDATLTMLVCATRWLSMHLYTPAYMSMHEPCLLVCRPCFNTMKLWTFDPNLHLSIVDTSFCVFSCLFAFSFVCSHPYFYACHVYHAYLLYAYFIHTLHIFLPLLACWFLVFAFVCMHVKRGHFELGHNLPSVSKKGADRSMSI